MMVPISVGPVVPDEQDATVPGRSRPIDPVRLAVLAPLALYLMPVALIVFLIGGIAVAAQGAASLAGRLARKADRGPARVVRAHALPGLAADRGRSEAAR